MKVGAVRVLEVAVVLFAFVLATGCSKPEKPADGSEPVATTAAALSTDSGADSGPAYPSIGSFAIYATEALEMNSGALVTGCNVGVENTTGPFLGGNAAAYFSSGATIQSTQTLYAYSAYLNSGVSLGPVDTDGITANKGAAYGPVAAFPAMPAPPAMPSATAGTTSVTLSSNATKTLAAGAYGSVTVNSGATLSLTGGTYVFSSLTLNSGATMSVAAATTLSVTGSANFSSGSFAGPASGSGLTAKALALYLDSSSGVSLSSGAQVQALFIATNARVTVNTSKFTGALAAAQVVLNSGATVTCQDGFGSLGGTCPGGCNDGNPCMTGTCSAGTCTYAPVANGTTCPTGANLCDQTYSCQAGVCTGSNPVACTASDQCHVAGTCNPSTGTCSNPDAANGTACNDDNACTQTDACENGTCTGSNPVTCTASDQCHAAGTCSLSTGVCSNPTIADGTSCTGTNACLQAYACESGTCTGSNPVACVASDQCHVAGTCNPSTGTCSNPDASNGTTCTDGNACTQVDTCQTGACVGSNPVTCTASDQCHVAGTCNPSNGTCSNPTASNGTTCNDGNACTQSDSCQSGTCVGGNPVTCTASDQCHAAGTCSPSTGTCSNPTVNDGTSCTGTNPCDQTYACESGTCTGSNPVTCTASDQCHVAGTCDPTSGSCSNPAAANGTTCNDGNACTQADSCQSGTCQGSPVTCTASDQCHVAGTCDPSSGQCSNPAAPSGTSCNDGNSCSQTDACQGGVCTGSNPVTCPAPGPQLVATTSFPSPIAQHAATELASGDVLVTGGTPDGGTTVVASAWIFRAATATWSEAASMNDPRYGHTSSLLPGGRVLVAGGNGTEASPQATAEIYDPTADTWTLVASMNASRFENQAVTLPSGQVLVVGAPTSGPFAEVFDPVAGTWTAEEASSDGGASGAAPGVGAGEVLTLLANGQVLVAGGSPGASVYSPSTRTWASVGATPSFGPFAASALLPSGQVLVAGGVGSASAFLFTPQSNTWTAAGTMSAVRAHGAGALLPNGVLLVDGGGASGADIYSPSTGQWSAVASTWNRSLQTATPTASGAILVLGGVDSSSNTLSSAELFSSEDAECVQSACNPQSGQCTTTSVANGTSCNDGNACFGTQACQSGYCVPSNPVICTSSSPCQSSACVPSTGQCTTSTLPNGTACSDGNLCSQNETCQAGACSGTPVTCTPSDACHSAGTCNPTTGTCSNPAAPDGTSCPSNNACFQTFACTSGTCVGSNPVTCTASDQCHAAGTCDPTTGSCSNPAASNGTTCNDGNACTQTDSCESGVCTGSNPVACSASDQCHAAGTCNPSTGVCSNPTVNDGTACAGTNACFGAYACESGACTGSSPVVCVPSDQCHVAGSCDPTSGMCSNPAASNGTTCNDGNACTQADSCQNGTCTGSNPVTCTPSDQCHAAGTCNPSTGACSNPTVSDGTSCTGTNACFQSYACTAGTCTGSSPVTCTASDQCHVAGTCNTSTGSCSNPAASNGTTCNDGNACTQSDSCQSGTCVGTQVTCTASDQCHAAGTCNPSTGTCSNPTATDGTSCTGTNPCNQTYACESGTCRGSNPVTCTASDQCHVAGTCNPSTGACSNPAASDGTTCNDGNACTESDACQSGTCVGGSTVTCTASDQCHVPGICDPTSGCSNPTATDGTTCTGTNSCFQSYACAAGTCTGGNPVVCTASDQCHAVGTCDPTSGTCSNPAVPDGTGCTGSNVCNQTYACLSGACSGSNPVVCAPSDQCHVAGTCDPTFGCSNPAAPDGTSCTSTNAACTTGGSCLSGNCDGVSVLPISTGNACLLETCSPTAGIQQFTCNTLDRSVSTNVFVATSFLYSGSNPIQTGVAAGTIVPSTVSMLTGQVLNSAGSPLPGVTITIANHPEFGSTLSQGDGAFDMAVNGGQTLRVHYALASYLSAERLVQVGWQDYAIVDPVVLVQASAQVTPIELSSSTSEFQVARGATTTDSTGTRTATLLIPPRTEGTMTLPGGATTTLETMHVRATEFSVGANGALAVPGTLPPTSGYAYAVELSADEAIAVGATALVFSQPVPFYLENYLGFPVGTPIPLGTYSSTLGAWVASANGVVLQILSVAGGVATVDTNGDGLADTESALAALGVTDAELQQLAALYTPGQALWRIPIAHFSDEATGFDGAAPSTAPDAPVPCSAGIGQTECPQVPGSAGDDCRLEPNQGTDFCGEGLPSDFGCDGDNPQHCYMYCCPQGYAPASTLVCATNTCDTPPAPPGSGAGSAGTGSGGSGPSGDGPAGCDDNNASTIRCQRQSLGEDLPLAGTPYTLHYESDRQRGRQPTVNIPISASLPAAAIGVEMDIHIAGRLITQSIGALSFQTASFTWDGLDAYGRLLQGAQPIHVQLLTQYPGVYQNVGTFGNGGTGTAIAGGTALQTFSAPTYWDGFVELWDSLPDGLGGWTVNIHHTYDVTGHILRLGDGSNRTFLDAPPIALTVAGNGASSGSTGDGGSATAATVSAPSSVAVGADGSLYIADGRSCVRRVLPGGTILTFAGQCSSAGFSGDGGPATLGQLQAPSDLAVGMDGSLYIADTGNNRVRRVDPFGTLSTVAGTGAIGFSGDGGPAVQAKLSGPTGVDSTPDGSLYVADLGNQVVRRISPDGNIATVAGNGSGPGVTGNEGPATAATLASAARVRVGRDGSLYLAETAGNVVRRVGPDGIIRAFAGSSVQINNTNIASSMVLQGPLDVAVGPEGSLYIVDQTQTVRRVDSRGNVTTVFGVAGVSTFGGDNGPAAAATMGNSLGLRVAPDGTLYVADTADNRIRRVQTVLPGFAGSSSGIVIPSADGTQTFAFDGTGRHQQTVDAFTGAVLYAFAYDGAGRLVSVTDVNGDVTQFNHNASGNLTSVLTPFGQTTSFTADPNGYLASSTDPSSAVTSFTYSPNGLLQTKTDARSGLSQYTYDTQGRLTQDQDPAGGSKTLSESDTTTGSSVTLETSMGVQTILSTSLPLSGGLARIDTLPSGFQGQFQETTSEVSTVIEPDSTKVVTTDSPDPRFGMLAPVHSVTTTTPLELLTSTTSTSRSVTLSGGSLATFLEQTNTNGNTWQRLYTAATRAWTTTSPAGRTSTTTLDATGRPSQVAFPNVTPFSYTYDAHGHLTATTQGTRTWTQTYDANGNLASKTDPLGHTVSFANDPLGRPTTTTLADLRTLRTSYDGDGNATQIVLPSSEAHNFSFTPVNQLATYTPPSLGPASPATSYVYDLDRRLTNVARPDGVNVSYAYDTTNRLQTITMPLGTISYGYDPNTGYVASIVRPDGETLSNGYDGFLRPQIFWSGTVGGGVSFGFDNNFRVVSQTAASSAVSVGYDADGLVTQAGALTLTRNPANGFVTGTIVGSVADGYTYDSNGLFASYGAQYAGTTVYSESVQRDPNGRITQKTESVQGTTHVWNYTYDVNGRLTEVTEDGGAPTQYGYDADDNRTTFTGPAGTISPTYDAQDRLLTYGTASYAYTADGELTTKTDATGTATYTYDPLGNLLDVALPSGESVSYVVDGENRRVAKAVNGKITEAFLYQDSLRVVAQLDGSGNLVARYVFGTRPNVPDYFTTSAGTFRILSDHLGSPRLIVNASTGAFVEEIDYDEFGIVTNDTQPGTTPFGFAGGLYDADTRLVRFGARDYDANVGRWTTKDSFLFRSGQLNLYVYLENNPVSLRDPTGHCHTPVQSGPYSLNGCGSPSFCFPDQVDGANFGAACDIHDAAYQTCGYPKAAADWDFLQNLISACEYTGVYQGDCVAAAVGYYVGVTLFSGGAYAQAQGACAPPICLDPSAGTSPAPPPPGPTPSGSP